MKPVLIVEGKEMKVIEKHYHSLSGEIYKIVVCENNPMESNTYYDIKYKDRHIENSLKVDFSKYLIDKSESENIKEIHSIIENLLNVSSEKVVFDSIQHTEACLVFPFSSDVLKQKYSLSQREQLTLMSVLEIVEDFMEDDVDLSGGEEIER